jgi:hypothetical protein
MAAILHHSQESGSIAVSSYMELKLEKSDFRLLSEYLLENWEYYQEQLQPIILGKLLQDEHKHLKQIYLVATDQAELVKYRDKDTLYAAQIIKLWIENHYKVPTKVILQGAEGGNPADFEAMFHWWKQTWQHIAASQEEGMPILLCVKGGVGAFSEAGRVTALSRFGEDTLFYDFIKDDEANCQGKPSEYTIPFKGTNYLWDRKQREALALLQRYDYEAVGRTLKSYYREADASDPNSQLILRVKRLVEAATKWNQGDFQGFVEALGEFAITRSRQWWWTSYEAAYLGATRFKQGNTVEALFHTFRAVEGLMCEWAIYTFPDDVVLRDARKRTPYGHRSDDISRGKVPLIKKSIACHPGLQTYLHEFEGKSEIPLYGTTLDNLVQQAKPNYKQCRDIIQYGSVKGERERGKGIKNSFTLYPLPFPHSPNSKLKMLNRTVLRYYQILGGGQTLA